MHFNKLLTLFVITIIIHIFSFNSNLMAQSNANDSYGNHRYSNEASVEITPEGTTLAENQRIYVAHYIESKVSVVDVASKSLIKIIDLPHTPRTLVPHPNGKFVYVNDRYVINTLNNLLEEMPHLDGNLRAISPDGKYGYFFSPSSYPNKENFNVVDLSNYNVIKKVTWEGKATDHIDGNESYTTPFYMEVSKDGRIGYIMGVDKYSVYTRDNVEIKDDRNTLFILDLDNFQILQSIESLELPVNFPTNFSGSGGGGTFHALYLFLSSNNEKTFISNWKNNYGINNGEGYKISIIDLNKNKVNSRIAVDWQPWGMFFEEEKNYLWVANYNENSVQVIDINQKKSIATIPVGQEPANILSDLNNSNFFIINSGSGSISVVDPETYNILETIQLGLAGSIYSCIVTIPEETTVTISGRVATSGGNGIDGVVMTFSGGAGTVITSGGGNYSGTVNTGWSGTVTPSYDSFDFEPPSRSYINVTENKSNQNFTGVKHSGITVTYPSQPGITWQIGKRYTIEWTYTGSDDPLFAIELYKGNNLNRTFDIGSGRRSLYWIIPAGQEPGTDYKIKVMSNDDSSIFDISDNLFTILDGEHTVIDPYDLNGDGAVDGTEIVLIVKAFGATPGSEKWNPKYDLNHDNIINAPDLTKIGTKYNSTPPVNLVAANTTSGSILLVWENGGDKEDLIIERKENVSGTWATIATLSSDATTYTDSNGLSSGTSYYYRVRTDDEYGNHRYSNEASATTLSLTLNISPNDAWANVHQDITFRGKVVDESGVGINNANIEIGDGLKGITRSILTGFNGTFEYVTSASRSGTYHITFNYINKKGEVAAFDNALVDIDNSEIVAIFQSVKLQNITSEPLIATLTYQGPICADDPQLATIEKQYDLDPFAEKLVIDGSNLNYSPNIIDSTPEFGPPESGSISIGRQLCPLQLGFAEFCGPDPEDPNTQVFSVSAGIYIIGIGLSYDRQNKDFCLSVGPGGNVPYMISGGAAVNYCSNGMTLSASLGSDYHKGTWSLKVWNREESQGMDAITTFVPIYCPIDPYLTDPVGRHIGIDPRTKQFVNEIPYAIYTGPASEPQVISIPFSNLGNYDLNLAGQEDGDYLIQKQVIRNNQIVEQQIINGLATQGSSEQLTITVDTTQVSPSSPASLIAIPKIGSVELVWSAVRGASGYKIYYDSDTTAVPYFGKDADNGISPINVGYTQKYKMTGLDPNLTYYFALTSYDTNEIQSGFSDEVSVQILTDIKLTTNKTPETHYLYKNHPNPFNPTTQITYDLPLSESVKIEIYNILGNHIRTLVDVYQPAGQHSVRWDSRDDNGVQVPSGVYVYRLTAGEFAESRKMLLLR